jgi:hypothetical protein
MLGGENRAAGKLLGLECRGPILIFRETKSGNIGKTTIKSLQKKPKKKRKRATLDDLVKAAGILPRNVITIEPSSKIIPDTICEYCSEPAIYPVIRVETFGFELKYCETHHPMKDEQKKKRQKS